MSEQSSDDEPTKVGPAPAPEAAPAPAPTTGTAPVEKAKEVADAVAGGVKDAAAPFFRFLDVIGSHLIMTARALAWLPRRPFRGRNYLEAMEYIGFGSLPIVLLVGLFTGAVLSLQSVFAFRQLGFESFSGAATGKALSLELAPVLTSLMLAGRAGAGIATELGTMRISEQIDALETMAVSPTQFLVLPRVIGGILMTPLLMLVFYGIGMLGGYVVAVYGEGVDHGSFVENYKFTVDVAHIIQGIVKSLVFGLAFSTIGCYQGYNASGGGRGVGLAMTRAVVIGSVSILILDFFLTKIILPFMPPLK